MSYKGMMLGLVAGLCAAMQASAAIWYVDKDNTGAQNGTSWGTAYTTIQQAIDSAAAGDRVWVAEGVYDEQRTADAAGSLVLKTNVSVYGGFIGKAAGGYETQLSQRNWLVHVVTIDGANGRGAGVRAYHVVKGTTGSTLDGFTITGGNANGSAWNGCGGGFFSDTSGGTVSNCVFTANSASLGGAIGNRSSSATYSKCTIYSNTAFSGAGVYNDGGSPVFSNCLLYRNIATNGGGLWSSNGSTASLANCTFALNQATAGAGLYADGATVTLVNAILYFDSGGEIFSTGATLNATYCNVQGGLAGTGNIAQNPVFADANVNDFRLGAGSPCINTGTSVGAPATDIAGTNRPQGAAYDMGAYEMAAPVADFTAVPSFGGAALAVQFTDTTVTPSCLPIAQWSWVFGDSATSPEQNPVHVYGIPGVFAVTLTVTTSVGSSSKTSYIGSLASVQSVQVVDGLHVDVQYNGAMGSSASSPANYTLSGTGKGTLAANPTTVTLVGPNRFRLEWTAGEMVPGGDITITVSNVLDAYGNVLSGFNSATDPRSGVGGAPGIETVAVTSGTTVDVTYNRPMGAGATTAANYAISGTGKGTLNTNPASVALAGNNKYRLTWSSGEMIDRGDIVITVSNVSDAYGNAIGVYNTGTHAGGAVGVAPRVTAVAAQTAQTIDVTFSEAMGAGVTSNANYVLSGPGMGSLSPNPTSVALNSGNKYRLTWVSGEMVNGATITVTVSGVYDAAANPIAGINNSGTHYGGGIGTAPTVTALAVQSGSSMDMTFSELLGEGALVPTNYIASGTGLGSLSAYPAGVVYVGSNKYRLTWTSGEMRNGGAITVTVSNVKDPAGNTIGSTGNSGTVAGGAIGAAPTVIGVSAQATNAVNILFSEAMNAAALTNTNYALSGSGKGSLSTAPNSVTLVGLNTYRLGWNTGEMVNGGNITVTASGMSDLAGNPIGSPNSGTDAGAAVASVPTVQLTSATPATTGASPIPVSVAFSEPVTGFTGSDIVAGNASVANFAGTGLSYTFNLVPASEGLVTANIPGGIATDAAGNGNAALETVFTRVFARTSVVSATVVYNGMVDVVFSAAMGDGAAVAANYTLSGSGKGSLAAHPDTAVLLYGNTYRLTWGSGEMLDRGNVTITVSGANDAGGNPLGAVNTATHYSGAIGIPPTVYLSTEAQGATRLSPIPVRATFSEPVTGLTADGISPMNATVSNLQGSGTDYTFDLVPAGAGPVFAQVLAGAAADAAGNRVSASPMFVRLYDPNPPAAMVTLDDPSPTDADSVAFRVTFSEDVDDSFNAGNVSLLGSLAPYATFEISGASPSYKVQVALSNGDASGNIGIRVSASGIKDIAGNDCANDASAYYVVNNEFGFASPPEGGQVYAGEPFTFTIELEPHADPVVLQWKWENNQGVVADVGFDSPMLILPETNTAQSGRYWCEATYHGTVYSSRKATLTVVGLLTIVNQPQSVAVQTGQAVTLAVTASGGVPPLRYTWRKNGVDIPNANGPIYTIPSVQLSDAAGYSCQIRDDRTQSVTSEMAVVRITESLPTVGMPGLLLLSALLAMAGGVWIARRRALS